MIIGLFPFFIKIIQLEDKFAWVLVAAVADSTSLLHDRQNDHHF